MDSSTALLLNAVSSKIETIPNTKLNLLFIADENTVENLDQLLPIIEKSKINRLYLVSNRFDIIEKIKNMHEKIHAYFNDFELSNLDKKFDIIFYRISKEKALVHHIFNSFNTLTKNSSCILISGKKNEGIKSYASQFKSALSKISASNFTQKKTKNDYLLRLEMDKSREKSTSPIFSFDDNNYQKLRLINDIKFLDKSYDLWSKPGSYGWKKIDDGSLLLSTVFLDQESKVDRDNNTDILDLGCGSGILSMAAHALGIANITSTDNNASALQSCKTSFGKNNIKANVIADNCANSIESKFDLILCNPPFHKGFDTKNTLTEQFVSTAKRLLRHNGRAYFVTNSFIGIEKIAKQYFASVEMLDNNTQFKVIRLTSRKP